jgi:tRNA threonylcarbamoyladenosine biosynthesis protein TsaB
MALILNIDTATEKAGISLSKEGKSLYLSENKEQKEHATWLHSAVREAVQATGYRMGDLDAVAVTSGPGSYTGLRVGMAAGKGFCYSLRIPLITESTLKVMAFAAREQDPSATILCPMIDARRMEVFTAIYQNDLTEWLPAVAMVIDENSFSEYLAGNSVSFFGGGSYKCKPIITAPSATFIDSMHNAGHLGILSFLRYLQQEFTGLAYSEPAYTKEFHSHKGK